ncbi:MAG: protein-L-isoaspartate(D-aspartate) O-methyltransferase [Nitrospirales bacterium]
MRTTHGRLLWMPALIGAQLLILGCGAGSNDCPLTADPTRQCERDRMIDRQIVALGVKNPAVLAAMRRTPRHRFVPDSSSAIAYDDRPLPIGHDQWTSRPGLIAYMLEALELRGDEKVLEIGTGLGYQAAVLAEIVPAVFTIEIIEPLAKQAAKTLAELGYDNVTVRTGDGYHGWPEEAPFDAIIVAAATDHVPPHLLQQLAVGGRLLLPVGTLIQNLVLFHRTEDGYERTELLPVRFVPMTGEAEEAAPSQGGR